jgi:hypothetical protein
MKHAPLVAVFILMCALPLAAQSITVTKPVAGATCTKGQPCAIAWTVTGQPGATGIVELLEKTTTNVVRSIKTDAQIANLQYSWTVPTDVPDGQYRVRVRVAWLVVSAPGGVFTIKAPSGGSPPQPGLGTKKAVKVNVPGVQAGIAVLPVKILSPTSGATWEVGHQYLIKWTADTKPDDAFTVDLCNAAAVKVRTLLEGGAQHNPDGSWQIMAGVPCNDPEGGYKIRVTSWYAKKGATSGLVTAVIKTKKIVVNIPVQAQNGLISKSNIASANYGIECCGTINPADRARVGYLVSHAGGHDGFEAHFMRSRLTCDVSELANKKGEVESATLQFGDHQKCSNCAPSGSLLFCAGRVFALGAADLSRWNTFGPPPSTTSYQVYQLSGWSSAANLATGVDVKAPVAEWLKKTKPNLGFVVTAAVETYGCPSTDTCRSECVSFFHPIMYVTFIEKPDPCSSH